MSKTPRRSSLSGRDPKWAICRVFELYTTLNMICSDSGQALADSMFGIRSISYLWRATSLDSFLGMVRSSVTTKTLQRSQQLNEKFGLQTAIENLRRKSRFQVPSDAVKSCRGPRQRPRKPVFLRNPFLSAKRVYGAQPGD